jgi:hypothetical protein
VNVKKQKKNLNSNSIFINQKVLISFQSIKIYYIVLSAKMVEKSGREVRCVKFPRVPPNYCLTTIMLYSMLFDCKIGLDEQSKTSVSISNSMFAER